MQWLDVHSVGSKMDMASNKSVYGLKRNRFREHINPPAKIQCSKFRRQLNHHRMTMFECGLLFFLHRSTPGFFLFLVASLSAGISSDYGVVEL